MGTRENWVNIMNSGLDPTGCWKDYNSKHRYWEGLKRFAVDFPNFAFMQADEVGDEPDVDDYSNLDSDCA